MGFMGLSFYWWPALQVNMRSKGGTLEIENAQAVVEAQVDAYNAHDITAFAATYAQDAEIFDYPASLLMKGRAQIQDYYGTKVFMDPLRHAIIENRIVMGNIVVDHEKVSLTFPEGPGQMEAIVIYEVSAGKIVKATLVRGKKTLAACRPEQIHANPNGA